MYRLFLVRHFDRVSIPGNFDPPLSPNGIKQGQTLKPIVHELAPNGFRLIVTTEKLRAQQSLALLEAIGPPPVVSPLAERITSREGFLALITDEPGNVLIVGHEDTCKDVRQYYWEMFGVEWDKRERYFLPGRLAVVDFATRTVTNY